MCQSTDENLKIRCNSHASPDAYNSKLSFRLPYAVWIHCLYALFFQIHAQEKKETDQIRICRKRLRVLARWESARMCSRFDRKKQV